MEMAIFLLRRKARRKPGQCPNLDESARDEKDHGLANYYAFIQKGERGKCDPFALLHLLLSPRQSFSLKTLVAHFGRTFFFELVWKEEIACNFMVLNMDSVNSLHVLKPLRGSSFRVLLDKGICQ